MLESYKDIMSIEDLCECLDIGRNSAYELLNDGLVKAFRVGNRWKIPKSSVIEFINTAHLKRPFTSAKPEKGDVTDEQ